MSDPRTAYAGRTAAPDFAGTLPIPYVRASLGGRTMAYLLDILFIFGFTAFLTLLITVVGLVTSASAGPCSRCFGERHHLQRHHRGGAAPEHHRPADDGLRVVARRAVPGWIVVTAAVHASSSMCGLDLPAVVRRHIAFGLVRSDRRLGHDLLLGLAVVPAR